MTRAFVSSAVQRFDVIPSSWARRQRVQGPESSLASILADGRCYHGILQGSKNAAADNRFPGKDDLLEHPLP
jgi:hypothetical protein